MRKAFVLLAALTSVSSTFAVEPAADILARACQGLKRQADRNECVAEIARSASAQTQPQQARAETALEAARAIQSVVSSGVSLRQYQPYVQRLSIELDKFRSGAQTQSEKDAASLLADALQAYSDAGRYWQADVEPGLRGSSSLEYAGTPTEDLASISTISERYGIPLLGARSSDSQKQAHLSGALNAIWAYAKDQVDTVSRSIESPGLTPRGALATTDAVELNAPKPVTISPDFVGGSYTRPDYSAGRLNESIAGLRVRAYAKQGAWLRLTPKGIDEQWMPLSQLSSAG